MKPPKKKRRIVKKGTPGRPSKYTPKAVRTICQAVGDGTPFKHAAAIGGISYETFCQWRTRFPDFSDAIDAAVAKGIHARLQLILESAEGGNVKAATWWLEHVMPEDFSRSSLNIKHQVKGEIDHTHSISPETLKAIAEARSRNEGS